MFITESFLALSFTTFLAISASPGIASDPALVTKLEQARPPVSGKNGYQALFELPLTNEEWPDELPKCERYAPDCLAQAQQNLVTYRNVLPEDEKNLATARSGGRSTAPIRSFFAAVGAIQREKSASGLHRDFHGISSARIPLCRRRA